MLYRSYKIALCGIAIGIASVRIKVIYRSFVSAFVTVAVTGVIVFMLGGTGGSATGYRAIAVAIVVVYVACFPLLPAFVTLTVTVVVVYVLCFPYKVTAFVVAGCVTAVIKGMLGTLSARGKCKHSKHNNCNNYKASETFADCFTIHKRIS
jgi:hypothetical protein